jgi:hypothetical protein
MAFAVDGAVSRRPCCGIENPREVIDSVVERIGGRLRSLVCSSPGDRAEIEDLVTSLVSGFDGVMRSMLTIVYENVRYFEEHDPNHIGLGKLRLLPAKLSFQNLKLARQKLLPSGFDMAAEAAHWGTLVRVFQKRHLIAHRLGVVDSKYLAETNDPTAVLGKRISFTTDEILTACRDCQTLVRNFFGHFLS